MSQPAPIPPKEWPKRVLDLYDPVRTLGVGGFASVMLAKKKSPGPNDEKLVAIKIVGSKDGISRSELGYARRETEILRELNHPNIMKVIDYWEPDPNSTSAAVMALSYARGPTVESLIQHRGALSNAFSRTVIAQVIDAISHLHSHAVIHRDLKPDNIIVTGAKTTQDEIWENTLDDNGTKSFADLRKMWHVTVIDFGFARALTPRDLAKPSHDLLKENQIASYSPHELQRQEQAQSKSNRNLFKRSSSSKELNNSQHSLDRSLSRYFTKRMSALGNRHFAAPEILTDMNTVNDTGAKTSTNKVDITQTLSTTTSEYGLMVDAYSVGHTLRYMMTGVPPHQNVEDVLKEQKSLGNRLSRWTHKKMAGKSAKPKKRYRLETNLPEQAQKVIADMTERLERNRTSVRGARRYPWISEVLPKLANEEPDKNARSITYLNCAISEVTAESEQPLPVTVAA